MARWIDAELLAKSYLNVAKEEHLTGLIFISPEDVAKTILKLSEEFEDVAPVVHAHKVRVHSQGGGTHWVVCSHCEKPIDWQDAYCKHCGAIMDEEVE